MTPTSSTPGTVPTHPDLGPKILIVDDESQILRALRINLSVRHYDVVTAMTGRQAIDAVAHAHPDLVLLDLGLPDIDGIDVIHALRGWTAVPIVVLSGRNQTEAKVRALDAGADDYVSKPFNVDELLARVRAVSRRAVSADESHCVTLGTVRIDLDDHRVVRTSPDGNTADIRLTPTEWQLVQTFARNAETNAVSANCPTRRHFVSARHRGQQLSLLQPAHNAFLWNSSPHFRLLLRRCNPVSI